MKPSMSSFIDFPQSTFSPRLCVTEALYDHPMGLGRDTDSCWPVAQRAGGAAVMWCNPPSTPVCTCLMTRCWLFCLVIVVSLALCQGIGASAQQPSFVRRVR